MLLKQAHNYSCAKTNTQVYYGVHFC